MKNKFLKKSICILGVLGVLAVPAVRAQSTTFTNLISLQTVNGSATGSVQTISVSLPTAYYQVVDGPITNPPVYQTNVVNGVTNIVSLATNAIMHVKDYSFDNANWVASQTNFPSNTNGIPNSYKSGGTITIYTRDRIITTNGLPASLFKQN